MARICEQSASYAGSVVGSMWLEYSFSTNNDTTAVITARPWVTTANAYTMMIQAGGSWTLYNTTANIAVKTYVSSGTTQAISTEQSVTISKTHEVQYIGVNYYLRSSAEFTKGSAALSYAFISGGTYYDTIRVEPKSHYTVSYNANGGSGAPTAQTKWYGETLKLQTGTPIKTGWTFKGWSTSSTATSATYAAGANYTANSGATLYAVWQRNTYTVSYNANGGTGAPSNQTKQYGIDLVLSNAAPTFSGWTFKGWATSTANASVGTVNYPKGGTYQGNSAITLYAVWELTYKKPTISNISVERCTQSGELEDDGDCALVTADWEVFRSSLPQYYGGNTYPYADNAIDTDGYVVTAGTYTETRTPTGESDDGYSVVVGSGFDSDTAYSVTVSITDTQEIVSDHTTTATGTLSTQYFPMDYNADATAVGFFMPAPNSESGGDGAYFGKDIHVYVDTSTASGTDAVITQALSDLGWTNDVLE